jgi:hypothetical protein
MVMARRPVDVGRRAPRRFPRVALVVLCVATVAVAVNSIVRSSARGPDAAVGYADRVRPHVDRSTRQAAAIEDLRNQVGRLPADGLRRTLDRLVRDGRETASAARKVDAPDELGVAHGLLVTCLQTRANALAELRAALTSRPEVRPNDDVARSLQSLGRSLAVSDQSYRLFLDALPEVAQRTLPASTWVPDEARWDLPEMAALVGTVRSSVSSAPIHDIALVTVTPTPSPVDAENGVQVLPRSRELALDVVVANAGNTAAKRVPVEAVATATGGLDTARQFVDLEPGQRVAVRLGVRVAAGPSLSVQVKVGPVDGEAHVADNERALTYVVR